MMHLRGLWSSIYTTDMLCDYFCFRKDFLQLCKSQELVFTKQLAGWRRCLYNFSFAVCYYSLHYCSMT